MYFTDGFKARSSRTFIAVLYYIYTYVLLGTVTILGGTIRMRCSYFGLNFATILYNVSFSLVQSLYLSSSLPTDRIATLPAAIDPARARRPLPVLPQQFRSTTDVAAQVLDITVATRHATRIMHMHCTGPSLDDAHALRCECRIP